MLEAFQSASLFIWGGVGTRRLFSHAGRFYVLSWLAQNRNHGADCDIFAVDLKTGARRMLSHDLYFAGGNWMPVMGHSTPWPIRSIIPLIILEADLATFPESRTRCVANPTSFWDDRLVCCRTAKRRFTVQPAEHGIFQFGS